MKILRRLTALTLGLLLLLSLAGCAGGDQRQIRSTLKTFETACQQLDLNAMLDCMDPDTAQAVRNGASLLGQVTGQSAEEVLDATAPFLFGDDYTSSDFLRSFRLTVEDIAVAEDSATALCTLSCTLNGEEKQRDVSVRLVKLEIDGKQGWYISDLD